MGSSVRKPLNGKNLNPPPNTYNPNFGSSRRVDPSWGFGSGKRGKLTVGRNDAPSSQTYNIPSRAIEGRPQSMGLKLDKNTPNKNPGPGTYLPEYKSAISSSPAFSMKGRYKHRKPMQKPDPGTYETSFYDKRSAPKFGFGSEKLGKKERERAPGPGAYHIPSRIGERPIYVQGEDKFKYI